MTATRQVQDKPALPATESGKGPQPVVLVHGWTCNRRHWQSLLASPPQGTRLIAVDLPGHGEAQELPLSSWTVKAQAQALVSALADIDNPVLVGHSMGGAVVLEAARLKPVKAVVLVDTFVIPYGDLDEETARQIETPFQDNFVSGIANLVANNAGPDLSEQEKQTLEREMAAARQDAMLPLWSDLLRWSPNAAFAEINCPIHAINGDLVGEAARARCAPYVTEWLQAGTWHFPQMEQPEVFADRLTRVLKSCG
ncbi:alpha/beta hydrolase [Alcanivorax sp.]|jgi:pimeloyl-ACP methyl ester carboxylesterase|uniref:alpha/beta fold hydrolase n=1 Tax=Alcanivorax sp. TaxID=1872427 RepID=UPI00258999AC|nr:alpha/beta hydrolase [Alcanivorax sp.]